MSLSDGSSTSFSSQIDTSSKNKRYLLIFLSFCSFHKKLFLQSITLLLLTLSNLSYTNLYNSHHRSHPPTMSMVFSRLHVLPPKVHEKEAANPSPPNVNLPETLFFQDIYLVILPMLLKTLMMMTPLITLLLIPSQSLLIQNG